MFSGDPLPEEILNSPDLADGLQFYMQAFNDLDTERSHSMGVAVIPWSKITEYGRYHQLSKSELDDLHVVIRLVDNAYCEWLDKASKQSRINEQSNKPKP